MAFSVCPSVFMYMYVWGVYVCVTVYVRIMCVPLFRDNKP